MPVIRYYRNKITNQVSQRIYDVIGDKVTLKPNFEVRSSNRNGETCFKEIEIIPVEEMFPYNELSNVEPGAKILKLSSYVKEIRKLLVDDLEKRWSLTKFHFLFHSSGYDSRILSMCLRELYLKNGKDWLGDIIFVCQSPEEDSFKEIMKYQGWKKSQYKILKDKPFAYNKEGFDYKITWKHLNGEAEVPTNFIYNVYNRMKKRNLIPQDDNKIQIWGNWVEAVLKDIDTFAKLKTNYTTRYYGEQARGCSVFNSEFCDMYLNSDLIKFMIETRPDTFPQEKANCEYYNKFCKLRELVLGDELVKFRRWNWQEFDFIWVINDKLLQKAIDDYKHSWYYKNVNKEIVNSAVNYYWERPYKNSHKWWNAWSMGSFTNHLIRKGVEIV